MKYLITVFEKGVIITNSKQFTNILWALILLCTLMVLDHVSGKLALKKEMIDCTDSSESISRERPYLKVLYKQIGYIVTIIVCIIIDFVVYKFANEMQLNIEANTTFGLLITIWFIISELLSILDNVGRMGVVLPQFLKKMLNKLKKSIR